jgi:hypothetical protein
MVFTPDQNYTSQSLVIDPTGPSHIHLRAPGANIDEPDANIFLGGEESSFEVGYYNGNVPNLYIHSGGNTWTFDNAGNLTLPLGSIVYETNIPDGALSGSAIALKPIGGTTANQQLLIYPTAADGDHIHMTSGNLYATELFLGSDNFYVKLANTGNVIINSNDGNSSNAMWTFSNDGTTTFPTGNITSNTSLQFTTTFANVKTVEYQTAGIWDLYVEDSITGSNTASSRLNVSFKDNLIDKPQVYIENTKESDGIALRWTFDENGNLNFPRDVAGNTDPYLTITGGANPKILSEDASLAGPANLEITALNTIFTGSSGSAIKIYPDDGEVASDGNLQIWANSGGNTEYSWTFDTTGNLTTPSNLVIGPGPGSGSSIFQYNEGLQILGEGANSVVQLGWTANTSAPDSVTTIAMNYPGGGEGNVLIAVGNNATTVNYWLFDNTGNLRLPGNTFAVNYANGTQVPLGGGGGLPLSNGNSIINIASVDGNITLDANGNIFTFGTDGNLTTPSNLVIGPTGLGSGTGFTQLDAPLLLGSSEANGGMSLVWYENPTGPGNVVQVGLNSSTPGSMTVTTGNLANTSYVWDFDNEGNLTLPSGGNLIVSGSIVSSGASPAPTLSGFSSVSALQFTNGNSNVTVNANSNLWTFDSTGNLTLPGNTFAVNYANGTQVPVGVTQDITSNGAMSIMTYDGNLKYVNYATVEPSTGNIAGGNISTTGVVTANTANITTGNITTINSGLLQNGNSNITITSNGNVSIQAAGSNVELVVTSTGANVTGTLTSTGKIGYASGSTVTQTTNRGTGVTINTLAGTIITTSAAMAVSEIDTFSVTNSSVDPTSDIVLAQIVSPNQGTYNCIATPAVIGGFNPGFFLNIVNISGFTTSDETITIRFMVIKAPNA